MSRENVDIVRHIYDSGMFDRDPADMMELAAPEIEYVNPPYAVEPGVRRGIDLSLIHISEPTRPY